MVPERIGRYRIVRELGRGGFATVFLGEDRGLDDLVAIKLLAETHANDDDSVARFVAEARVMRNLRAPGVVTVHDVGEHEGRPYFVMEYCEGGTLTERLASLDRPLTVDEGVGLARAIGRAMSGLHSAEPPVVHRDVKPGNLLIRYSPANPQPVVGELLAADEELIVGDFGLAKVVDVDSTGLSLIAYTRGFASPEQIRGDGAISPSADVYSASAVVLAAISGERPQQVFDSEDQVFSDEALALAGPLRKELERGLRFRREERHNTVAAWSDALTARAEAAQQLTALPAASAPDEASGARSRRLSLAAVAAVLAMLVAGLAFALLSRSGPTIVGPDNGRVGEEMAFAVLDATLEAWEVGGFRTTDTIMLLTPTSAGRVTIEVATDQGDATIAVDVTAADSSLQIDGPALLPLDQVTTLTATGADPAEFIWQMNGSTFRQESLDLEPSSPGTMKITVTTESGDQVSRTFTVS